MKICFFGDTKIHSRKWINSISNLGHDVFSVGPIDQQKELKSKHYGVRRINVLLYYLLVLIKLRKVIRRERPDVVVAHYITTYGFLANLISDSVICMIMGSDIWIDTDSLFKRYLVNYALENSSGFSVVSPSLKEKLIQMGVDETKIEIIPLGVEREKFNNKNLNLESLKNNSLRKFVQKSNILVLSTRKFEPLYDNMTIIKAAEIVISQKSEIKFVLMGIGPQRKVCQNYINSQKLNDNILLPGWLDLDKEILLANARIMISAAKSDGLPVSVLEALVFKCYPILGDVRGARDIFSFGDTLKEPRNVRFFSIGDFEELSKEILSVVSLESDIVHFVEENYQYAQKHFQFENILEDKFPILLSKI